MLLRRDCTSKPYAKVGGTKAIVVPSKVHSADALRSASARGARPNEFADDIPSTAAIDALLIRELYPPSFQHIISSECPPSPNIPSVDIPPTPFSRCHALRTCILCRRSTTFHPQRRHTSPLFIYCSCSNITPNIRICILRGACSFYARTKHGARLGRP